MTDLKTNLAVLRPEIVVCVKSTIESAAGAVWYDTMSDFSEDSAKLMQEAIYNRVADAIIERILGGI